MPIKHGKTSRGQASLHDRVTAVVDALRPMAQRDGGDFELLDIDTDNVVHVRLSGACVGCPSSHMTLTMGIERTLKEIVPEVSRVVCASP